MIVLIALASPAAALNFDQNVTPDVIFGTGNDNGFFTTDIGGGVELGLRGKLRFDGSNLPQNYFGSNGDGTYTFISGSAPGGFPWLPDPSGTPIWNFEFAINTDVDGTSGLKLADLTYELGLDFDPDPASTNYLIFDPVTPSASAPYYDHSLGDNTTDETTDVVSGDAPSYVTNLSTYNVAQNSWNYVFFDTAPFDNFDPTLDGVYEIYLRAFDGSGSLVAETAISIVVGGAVATDDTAWGDVKALYR